MGAIAGIAILGLIMVIGIGIAIAARAIREPLASGVAAAVAALGAVGLLALFGLGGEVSVPVNTTGVPQAFGTVSGAQLGPGVHWTWQPWLTVTDIDETVQTTHYTGTIRIGGQQTAQANIRLKWQVRPQAADALFRAYANQGPLMATIASNVVLLTLESVVNNVMGDYDPITDVTDVANANGTQSLFTSFGPKILAQMRAAIGGEVDVLQLTMPNLAYTPPVEAKLQAIQQAYADYAIAREDVQVNDEKARALRALGSPTLAQLIAQCITQDAASPGQCIPGAVTKLSLSQVPQG